MSRPKAEQEPTPTPTIWTIGHSTRSIEEFIDLVKGAGIRSLVDVRRFPASRRYPHFNGPSLAECLRDAGIRYQHMPALGGRRPSRSDSPNIGWRNAGFRGYADYMQTDEFCSALEELMGRAETRPSPISPAHPGRAETRPCPTAIMCAEAVPWRCHRNLISDALVIRGWRVLHILSAKRIDRHTLTSFAHVSGHKLLYPAELHQPSLF